MRELDAQWIVGRAPADEPLIGSPNMLPLADLANSYEVVRTMRIVPTSIEAILRLAVATLAPIIPLSLTMIPLNELLKRLFGITLKPDRGQVQDRFFGGGIAIEESGRISVVTTIERIGYA